MISSGMSELVRCTCSAFGRIFSSGESVERLADELEVSDRGCRLPSWFVRRRRKARVAAMWPRSRTRVRSSRASSPRGSRARGAGCKLRHHVGGERAGDAGLDVTLIRRSARAALRRSDGGGGVGDVVGEGLISSGSLDASLRESRLRPTRQCDGASAAIRSRLGRAGTGRSGTGRSGTGWTCADGVGGGMTPQITGRQVLRIRQPVARHGDKGREHDWIVARVAAGEGLEVVGNRAGPGPGRGFGPGVLDRDRPGPPEKGRSAPMSGMAGVGHREGYAVDASCGGDRLLGHDPAAGAHCLSHPLEDN